MKPPIITSVVLKRRPVLPATITRVFVAPRLHSDAAAMRMTGRIDGQVGV